MLYDSINWNEIKHLRFTTFISNNTLALLKEQVYRMLGDRKKDSLFEKFMKWQLKDNEIMLYTDYSLIEFDLPTHFDTIIKTTEPESRIETRVIIPYSVINGWAAIDKIEKGHRHVCPLQFEGRLPEVVKCLPEVNSKAGSVVQQLIFCNWLDIST